MGSERKIHVIVIGAGFAGVNAARALAQEPHMLVTLIDRRNYHLFQPLLYQVAIAALEAPEIAEPVRGMLRKHRRARFLLGDVRRIDRARRQIELEDRKLRYDYLIVATGSRTAQPPVPGVAEHTIGLKDLNDALRVRDRIIAACEEAARERDVERRQSLLHFIIVGGGPTGVELAGMLSEFGRTVLPRDYPEIPAGEFRVSLIDGNELPLATFTSSSRSYAREALATLGVDLHLGVRVDAVTAGGVRTGDGQFVNGYTTFWTAGVVGAEVDGLPEAAHGGRIETTPLLHVPDDPRVYVAGDLNALADPRTGQPYAQVAQVAMQQGRFAAANITLDACFGAPQQPFHYRDYGSVATIGRNSAVVEIGRFRLTGAPAWFGWAGIHIVQLVGFRNRLLVMLNWIFNYFSYAFGVRIMYRKPSFPGD